MDPSTLTRVSEFEWRIEPQGDMRVPGIIFASEDLIRAMDEKVREQVTNVATLPGVIKASYAMPDAHWGYGLINAHFTNVRSTQGGIMSFSTAC